MKYMKALGSIILIVLMFSSCNVKNKSKARDLYHAIYNRDIIKVDNLLKNGADPNYCYGESGWVDSNPLNVVTESFYDTYYRRKRNAIIPNPTPDVKVFELLVEAGADLNRRPYIWNRVNNYDNAFFDKIKDSTRNFNEKSGKPKDYKEHLNNFIEDSNRILKVLLEAGADPELKGHSYPFSSEALHAHITDKKAKEYFENGSRAINVAIAKGNAWESQVDLLLQYTKLDKESLQAAEKSNDPIMIEKINKLWDIQRDMKTENIH